MVQFFGLRALGSGLILLTLAGSGRLLASSSAVSSEQGVQTLSADISECYWLNWSDEESLADETQELELKSTYTWYCQARPTTESGYQYRQFHSYKDVRMDARDSALFRCERKFDSCVSRCALAPRVCAPHFWP